jgi:hypothetical protein
MKNQNIVVKHSPAVWQVILDLVVLSPDGWNRDLNRFNYEWRLPLTFDEFITKASASTCSKLFNPEELAKKLEACRPVRRSRDASYFRTCVKDRLSACQSYNSTSLAVSSEISNLKERFNLTQSMWDWAWGYRDAIGDVWARNNLVHAIFYDGKKISTNWNNYPEELKERIRKGEKFLGGIFWKDKDGNPGQEYFLSDEPR